ncbi:MAG: bifunctional UDP-N-acetylglucosamine diphosphorylase/glucosamine-1-phosphate N-acetyltransferase GlmU, partial [Actinomycetota bacterium]|nr:bifunctional UDP-N-acetylglucosamine diphosphorylase/glucosamine-1-phosphate N-acetyltransferase GlmU [Actinomycetota bacterium]
EGEGTGAAVLAARDRIDPAGDVVVLSGDHPLISPGTVAGLLAAHRADGAAATLLTTEELDPAGYGRVVRLPDGGVARIVETKRPEEATPEELAIREINIGAYAFRGEDLLSALAAVGEAGGERYLTGVFPVLRERGRPIAAHPTPEVESALGVNTRVDLMEVERRARRRLVEAHALAGVTFLAPDAVVLDAEVEIGEDSVIEAGVTLRGVTRIGRGCAVGPCTTMVSATLGDAVVARHAYVLESEVADGATVGPFAYLRPGTRVGEGAKVGTFVELKNAHVGARAKVPHLSYLGDAEVGEGSNIAAGNITANYDARTRRKDRTVIGREVNTGVDAAFVAPVHVGDGAYIAAGSVITEDVPARALGVARARQRNVEGYADRPREEGRQ